jgi:hypothetical protein
LATILWGLLLGFIFFVLSTGVVLWLVVRLPADHFCPRACPTARGDCHPAWFWTVRIVKNLAGALAVLLGIALSLPGIPGPGLVLILLGIALVDFPGKHRLERKILARPHVSRTLNAFRARFGKPPLILDESSPDGCDTPSSNERT